MNKTKSNSRNLVAIRIIKHLPIGLGVQDEKGQYGIIRLREISWNPEQSVNWKRNYPIGWRGEAYPLSTPKSQVREFSLRMVERDPWDDALHKIEIGWLFDGAVTGITGYGVFIEIASGITGHLHHSQLPNWVGKSPVDLFWPGDRVFVVVEDVNNKDRKISLGFPKLDRQIGTRDPSITIHKLSQQKDMTHELNTLLLENVEKQHFLIVEDDPEQSETLSNYLRHRGQIVSIAVGAEEALSLLQKTEPDKALIDVDLPHMDGLELCKTILGKYPLMKLIITTDWSQAESVMTELEELGDHQVELLIKPLLPEDLASMIIKTKSERPTGYLNNGMQDLIGLGSNRISSSQSGHHIRTLLDQLSRYLDFELVILFSVDKANRRISILDCSGNTSGLNKSALSQMIFSPVRDTAEDQVLVIINNFLFQDQRRAQFRYLLELYPDMQACIGVPVITDLPSNLALFALDKRPHEINPGQIMYVQAIASAVAARQEWENLRDSSIFIQRSALIGHLTRSMIHEINNLVGPLYSRFDNLEIQMKRMEKRQEKTSLTKSERSNVANELNSIKMDIRRMINTTRMFGRISSKGKNEILRIDEVITETIHLMRDICERSHVQISFTPPEHLLIVRNQGAALEQIIMNVLLNAVQQVAELRSDLGGWVHVRIEPLYEKGESNFFNILIEDNGPGIHVGLWNRIFEAGYTTRAYGSGLGLYISRKLIEDMGGRIYLKESHILSGTTFVLEVPYQLQNETEDQSLTRFF